MNNVDHVRRIIHHIEAIRDYGVSGTLAEDSKRSVLDTQLERWQEFKTLFALEDLADALD